ncbi:MAG TPA: PEP-CTERM sorting domain-containing protein [Chthoniobacteraceae bacterium]|nr:PEP-CTERM sorting domain-containing protein [Chthoniobacteraceae bacterium]
MKRFPSFWRTAAPAGLLFAMAATAPAETFTWNKPAAAPAPVYNWHWRDADNWNTGEDGVPGAGDTANILLNFTGASINITFAETETTPKVYPSVGLLNVGDTDGTTAIRFAPGGSSIYLTFDNLGSEARMTKTGVNTVDFWRSVSFKDDTVFDVQAGVVTFTTGNASLRGAGNLAIQGAGLTMFENPSLISTSFSGDLSIRSNGTLLMNTTFNVYTPTIGGNPVPTPGAVVTVEETARLGGGGTLGRHTTVESGGRLTPGTTLESAGVLQFTDGLTLETGAHFDFQLLSDTALLANRGTAFDGVDVSGGDLSIAEGVLFNVSFDTAGSSVDFTDAFWSANQEWLVFDGTEIAADHLFTLGNVSRDSAGNSISLTGGTLGFRQDGDGLYLTYTAVPEPGTAALLLMAGGLAAVAWRRKVSFLP